MNEGESASSQAHSLREQAAAAQAEAARLNDEAAAWEAGAEGERRVAAALSVLTPASNVIVMHDRLLRPGRSQANLDHIVVSPAGAYLIGFYVNPKAIHVNPPHAVIGKATAQL